MKIKISSAWLLTGALLLSTSTVFAQTTYTWTGTNAALGLGGDNVLQNTNNWSPVTPGHPTATTGGATPNTGDIVSFNGSPAGALFLTNMTQNTGTWDANDGIKIALTANQTSPVTIVQSNGFTGRIRLGPTNAINVASGAGALTFGNNLPGNFPLALGAINGGGNGVVCDVTNNSADAVTFNSEVTWVMGGGGSHPFQCNGSGNWIFNTSIQANNAGASMSLVVAGPGSVTLTGNPANNVNPGNTAPVTLAGGTLILGGGSAGPLAGSSTFIITGGSLDSSSPGLTISSANAESWNGNFTFVGSQSLNLGVGVVTMNASRTVTVNASTLEVDGGIVGAGASLTKAGAGKLILGGFNTYSNGTIITGGVLQLASGNPSGFPATGTAVGESLTNNGTMDLNGNSITVSTLMGSGVMDTTGGSATLTVGDLNANGSFSGTIQNTSGSLSLIKSANGTLTLGGASTYSGGTTVSAGTLLVTNTAGSATGSGAVTVNSGATFGGTGIAAGPVTWQSGSTATFTQGSPLSVSGSVSLNNNAITIFVPGGTPLGVGTNTLMTYNNSGSTGSFAHSATFTGAGLAAGMTQNITTSGGVVSLVVKASTAGTLSTWINNGNGNWSVPANWSSNPLIPHLVGDSAVLGISSAYTTITLDTLVTNAAITFSNANSFAIANAGNPLTFDNTNGGAAIIVTAGASNSIAPAVILHDNLAISAFPGASLTISNAISSTSTSRTLTLSGGGTVGLLGNNSYGPAAGTIGTTILGNDTLNLGNNNAFSTGDVSVGGSITVNALTPLIVANNIFDTNSVGLSDNGNNVTLSGNISGTGGFSKAGTGVTVLSGANSYNGTTSMGGGGTIQLGNASGIPGGPGDGPLNMGTNTTLDLHGFSPTLDSINATPTSATIDNFSATPVTLTVGASGGFGTFSGNVQNSSSGSLALVMNGAGQQTLAGIDTYSGGTTVSQGTLQLGSGATNGLIVGVGTGPVVDNGTLQFNLVATNTFTNSISGSGVVNLNNNNLMLVLSNANTFTGNLNVNGGALYLKNGNGVGVGPKQVFVSNGTAGNSRLYLDGSAGNITTPAGVDFQLSNLNGCLFNVAGSNTITGNIYMPFGGGAAYVIVNSGFLTLAGNVADGGTFNNSRTLQLGGPGNGLFSGTANDNGYNGNAIALGTITKTDSGTWTITGTNITDGALDANGGMLVLSGQWTTGPAVVNSGGTLSGSGSTSNLTVNAGGKFVPGAYGSVGSFTVSNFLTLSGATYVSLNKSLAQSNTVIDISPTNVVANSGSSLIVSNLGPALTVGDTFYLFSEPVTNGGSSMTIIAPPGVAFTNNLALNGSITVIPATATNPTNITAVVQGNQLILSWPADHTGWTLQTQTNSLAVGLTTNWVRIPGSSANNSYTNTINPTNGTVFYRMVYP
jgi:autotransporter-associated beta strand protein